MKISTRLTAVYAGLFITASVVIVALVNYNMRQQALHEAELKTMIILNRNLATHSYFSHQLKPKVFELTDAYRLKDYFEPAWMSSTFAIREIDKYFKALGNANYYYKECAINARSPGNEADSYEKAFIKELQTDPALKKRSATRYFNGEPFFAVIIRGEVMEESCLRCHSTPDKAPGGLVNKYGPERSFNRTSGEVVSAISIRIPLAKAYQEANLFSLKLSGFLLLTIFCIFIAQIYFNRRFILNPLNAVCDRAMLISTDEDQLGKDIPLPAGDELKDLTLAFNKMSSALRYNIDHLEDMVRQRTLELERLNTRLSEDIEERKRIEAERERLIGELQEALGKVKRLSGMLPICASCKRIRDDKGYWKQLESYIHEHSEAEFSHGICPECAKKIYPKYYKEDLTED